MERRITLRDVARVLKCHPSTISLALRNDPRLPEETREKVRRTAKEIGYEPDPMLKALASYRSAIGPVSEHGTLAWISNTEERQWGEEYYFRAYVKGAQRRARELGYKVEEFCLKAPGMSPERLTKILRTRGIQGVLVAPQPSYVLPGRIRMEWGSFSAVAFGYTLARPQLHVVTNHHVQTVRVAFRKLKALGYRRIGFCFSRDINNRTNGMFFAGHTAEMERWKGWPMVEPYYYDGPGVFPERGFKSWFRKNRPEAIVVASPLELETAQRVLGVRIPEELGVVCLCHSTKGYTCVDQCDEEIGASAVDMVVGMIHTNQRGIPEHPRRILIEGVWRDGSSVRRMGTAAVGAKKSRSRKA